MCAAQSEAECGCSGVDWTPVEVYSLREDVNRLERENAALRQDKERLDWLLCEDTKEFVTPLGRGKRITDAYLRGSAESYRAAIDEAMESTK
jgi:hypothetical protein